MNHQQKRTAGHALIARFQNKWTDGITAGEALEIARACAIDRERRLIADIEAMTLADMISAGYVHPSVISEDRR